MNAKKIRSLFATLVTAGSLVGCTSNTLVVVPQNQNNNLVSAIKAAQAPCRQQKDQFSSYSTAVAISSLSVQPQPAAEQHINGCALAKFQLDQNGKAHNITILEESPANFGYADALTKILQGSTYKPPVAPEQWYALMMANTFNPK